MSNDAQKAEALARLERAISMALTTAEQALEDGKRAMADFWYDAVIELQNQALSIYTS